MVIFVILSKLNSNYLFMAFSMNTNEIKMDKITWKKEYSSGLTYLDNYRRNYLDIVNELVDLCNAGACCDRLPIVFHRLAYYIEDYFVKKEMAIRDAPNIRLSEYKKEHQRFTSEISRFQERYSKGETDICREMVEFMVAWIENYIIIFGQEAPVYMRSKGYE
jgi:hemerythrin-like metal-binding protein